MKKVEIKISNQIKEILLAGRVEGNCYYLPDRQLDRPIYLKVNKVLTALGGKWNRKAGGHIFDVIPDIFETVNYGAIVDEKKTYQFFETPTELVEVLISMAGVNFDVEHDVLEPSAGKGAIARLISNPERIVCIEIQDNLCKGLADGGFRNIICANFLEITPDDLGLFDNIIMNPPFTNNQDIQHIQHAYRFLKPDGGLVAICSEHPFFANDKKSVEFREWLSKRGGDSISNNENAFKVSGTLVKTRTICIERSK
jgi:predicted RNA methylase